MKTNGFDAILESLRDEHPFNQNALNQLKDPAIIFGVDASEVAVGEAGNLAVQITDSNGSKLGAVAMLSRQWGYSADNKNMNPTKTAEQALLGLLNHHIEDGGLIG